MGKKETVVQSSPPPVTASQSAAEYAAALPQILQAQLEFQPQFDQATFDSFEALAPDFARVNQQVLEEFSPQQAALGEALATQALEGSEQGLPDDLRAQFLDDFKALAGNQVNAPIGGDFVAKNLLGEDLAFRQFNQNLGLSLSGKVPISTAFQQPSQFQVANQFGNAFNTISNNTNQFNALNTTRTGSTYNPLGTTASIFGGAGGLLTGGGFFSPIG
jgi:hypothetical protein